jgi:hypothetical protein
MTQIILNGKTIMKLTYNIVGVGGAAIIITNEELTVKTI